MSKNRKFVENLIKITNILTGEEDVALDVKSAAIAVGVQPISIYQAFNRGSRRVRHFVLELVPLDKFIASKRGAKNG